MSTTPSRFRDELYTLWSDADDYFEAGGDLPRDAFQKWALASKALLLLLRSSPNGPPTTRELTLAEYGEMLLEANAKILSLTVGSGGAWSCTLSCSSEDGAIFRTVSATGQPSPDEALHRALAALRELPQHRKPERRETPTGEAHS